MKMPLMCSILATSLLAASSALAAAPGGYIGTSFGGTRMSAPSAAEFDNRLETTTGIIATSSIDDTDTGWKLFGGYRFNRYFAAEGHYADLGELRINSNVTSPFVGTRHTTLEFQTFTASAVGFLPLAHNFEIFAKAGFLYWDADLTVTERDNIGGTGMASESDNATDLMYGFGAGYKLSEHLALRAEWELYKNLGEVDTTGEIDVEMWSAGIEYVF